MRILSDWRIRREENKHIVYAARSNRYGPINGVTKSATKTDYDQLRTGHFLIRESSLRLRVRHEKIRSTATPLNQRH